MTIPFIYLYMRAFLYKAIGMYLTLNRLPSLCPYSDFLSLLLLFFSIFLSRLIPTYPLSCFTSPLVNSFIVVLIVFPSPLFLRFFNAHISPISFPLCLPHLSTHFSIVLPCLVSPIYFYKCSLFILNVFFLLPILIGIYPGFFPIYCWWWLWPESKRPI